MLQSSWEGNQNCYSMGKPQRHCFNKPVTRNQKTCSAGGKILLQSTQYIHMLFIVLKNVLSKLEQANYLKILFSIRISFCSVFITRPSPPPVGYDVRIQMALSYLDTCMSSANPKLIQHYGGYPWKLQHSPLIMNLQHDSSTVSTGCQSDVCGTLDEFSRQLFSNSPAIQKTGKEGAFYTLYVSQSSGSQNGGSGHLGEDFISGGL